MPASKHEARPECWLLLVLIATLFWSGIAPYDRLTWVLETAPVWIAIPVLVLTHQRFRFTALVYALIAAQGVLLCVGGHYTYSRVPAFEWLKDAAGFGRNHFDRLGHIAQGAVPAMIAREIFLRFRVVRQTVWRSVLIVSLCLAISVTYELIECAAALAYGGRAEDFLGTQGDVWDTQADMFLAFVGAVTALCLLSRTHNRQLVAQPARSA